jgi:hypothetical protein
MGSPKLGTYTGTGSSINVEVGFVPDVLMIFNYTDGTPVVFWTSLMTAATSLDVAAAAASNAAGSVSPYSTLFYGFSTGADNSTSAKVYHYAAWKADQ